MTDGFPSQRASNAENVSIWWRHHVGAPDIRQLDYVIKVTLVADVLAAVIHSFDAKNISNGDLSSKCPVAFTPRAISQEVLMNLIRIMDSGITL